MEDQISCRSAKQSTIAGPTLEEMEYITASDATKKSVWVKNFLTYLGVVPSIVHLKISVIIQEM